MKHFFLALWLVLLGSTGAALGQARPVRGTVKGPDNDALPGVTVVLKGTTVGVTTNPDGSYVLTVPDGLKGAVLRFSFIGYVSQEIAVGSQSTIDVKLVSDTQSLDDVVVIGYQQVRRSDVTGAVSSVSAQQIKDVPVNSAAEALTGRLAGVQLTSSEGTPGNTNFQIKVRGGGSITQENSPLYIVDGVQIENALGVIAPQDIASVDVLKDASSTAIYGARGANGVVIITTKGGKEGRTTLTYNGYAGFRKITKTLGVMDPANYLNWEYERAQLTGTGASVSGGTSTFRSVFGSLNFNGDTLNQLRSLPNQDWQQQTFGRSAFQQTHNVSLSGGTKTTTYNLSLTRNTEDGIQLGSSYTRSLVNFRLDTKASDKLRVGFNARFNDQTNLGGGTGAALGTSSTGQTVNTGSNVTSRLRNAVQYTPFNLPNLAGDPTANFDPDFFNYSSLINPVLAINNEYREDKRRTLNMSVTGSYTILPQLVFHTVGGFDFTYANLNTFNGLYSPTIRQAAGGYQNLPFVSLTQGLTSTFNQSNVLDYNLKRGKHSLNVLLGQETYQQRTTQQYVQVNFLPSDITAERALANINQAVLPAGTVSQPVLPTTSVPVDYRLISGFGRINYSYDDKYLLTISAREDGSSKFEPGSRFGLFPGGAVAWRISKEAFFDPLVNTVSDMKLRFSYGRAGNNRIPDFLTQQLFTPGNASYALNHITIPATAATTLANPSLKWEITTTRDLGVDMSLFGGRVQFTADAYYNNTNDLLVAVPLPGFTGYTQYYANVGATSNRGLEFQLSGTVVQTGSFSWTASANASLNRNRIESLSNNATEIQSIQSGWAGSGLSGADYVARVGSPVGQMYGYVTDGYYTRDDFESYNYATRTGTLKASSASDASVLGQTVSIGTLKLRDVNGDGIVNESDKTVIGDANPKIIGGLNQQFTYKGFDASVFLNFVAGNSIYNANKIEFTTSTANTSYANLLSVMDNRVRYIDGNGALITDEATFNQANANASIWSPVRGNYVCHSYAVESGSFLRINNVTLGYSLPKTLTSRARVQQLRFYVTLSNLYTFTDYQSYYTIARQECLEVMAQRSQHTLNPSFADLWLSVNQQRRDSYNEILFEVGMAGSTATGDSKLGYYNGPRLNASPTYGSTQGAVTVVPTYFYAFDSLDVRRDITIAPYQYTSGSNNQSGVAFNTIYDGKFRRDWHVPPLPGTNNYLGYNWPIIRFADVLLMFAEADNELNGPTTAGKAALLEVRTRGFGGNAARAALGLNLGSKADMFNALVNERLLEFGSEGVRKYDLLRWNLLADKLAAAKANIRLMQQAAAPYNNVPQYQYYKVVNGAVVWQRSFYRPSPSATPAGTTRVNWRQAIDATYVANLQPNGTTVQVGTTSINSAGTGLAAEYVPGRGKELLPIPQTTLDTDPALKQNYGY